jgi:hypothetical protein
MSNNDKDFQTIKQAFLGKTVVSVDPPEADEAIAKFTMSDGSCFRLHATDLGYWIEQTVGVGQPYKSLETLFVDYYHCANVQEPTVEITPASLMLVSPAGNTFRIHRSCLNEWENKVVSHPQAEDLLAFAAVMGDVWRIVFSVQYGCPEELALPPLNP